MQDILSSFSRKITDGDTDHHPDVVGEPEGLFGLDGDTVRPLLTVTCFTGLS